MRVYLPLTLAELRQLAAEGGLPDAVRSGVAATPELAAALSVTEADELALIAALAASDLSAESNIVAVSDCAARVVDAELGEVAVAGPLVLADLECLMLADVESEELSWYGIQETADLMAAVEKAG